MSQDPANGKNLAKCLSGRFVSFAWVRILLKGDTKKAPQVGLEPTTLRLTAGCSAIELLRSNGTDGQNHRDLTRLAKAEKQCQSALRDLKPATGCSAIESTEERNGTDGKNRCDLTRLAMVENEFVNQRRGIQKPALPISFLCGASIQR